jgi:hypothetical protein
MRLERGELNEGQLVLPQGEDHQSRLSANTQVHVEQAWNRLASDATQPPEADDCARKRPPTPEGDPGYDADRLLGRGRSGGDVAYQGAPQVKRIVIATSPRNASDASLTGRAARKSPSPGDEGPDETLCLCATTAAANATPSPRP